jgi:hypothetical protein
MTIHELPGVFFRGLIVGTQKLDRPVDMTILVKDERAIFGHFAVPQPPAIYRSQKEFLVCPVPGSKPNKTWSRQQESPRPHVLGAGLAVPIRTGGLGWPSPATRKRPPGIKLKIAPAPIPATTGSSPPCGAARILEPDAARANCSLVVLAPDGGLDLGAAAPSYPPMQRRGRVPVAHLGTDNPRADCTRRVVRVSACERGLGAAAPRGMEQRGAVAFPRIISHAQTRPEIKI